MLTAAVVVSMLLAQTPAKPAEAPKPPAPEPSPRPVLVFAEGLATPESVLYDAALDQYLVSNIHGSPLAQDNNGYITVLSPDGKVVTPKLVAGGQGGVTLNAPKGMALVKGVLYVADIDTLRMFDRKTGAPKGEVKVEGATFLNDVAVGPGGRLFVSDSGLKAGAGGFEPSGSDAVYELKKGKLEPLAKGPELGRPNGLCFHQGALHVVTFGSGEVYDLDAKGQKANVVKPPKGALDGILEVKGGHLVSSWEGAVVYRLDKQGQATEVVTGVKAPADLGWDAKRGRVLVPRFEEHRVEAYEVK